MAARQRRSSGTSTAHLKQRDDRALRFALSIERRRSATCLTVEIADSARGAIIRAFKWLLPTAGCLTAVLTLIHRLM